MKLEEIINTVKYGELNGTSWNNQEKLPRILTYLNLGLLNLYTKFAVQEKQVIIQQYPQISIYSLSREYARSNRESKQLHKYILDTPFEPFEEDVLQITGVTDEYGREIPLNDDNSKFSYFTPRYNQLQIPNANENETTFVIYRAAPKIVDPTTTDLSQEVALPPSLLEPLTAFIAYKDAQAMGGQEGLANTQMLQARYDQLCQELHNSNVLEENVSPSNIKPKLGGYI